MDSQQLDKTIEVDVEEKADKKVEVSAEKLASLESTLSSSLSFYSIKICSKNHTIVSIHFRGVW